MSTLIPYAPKRYYWTYSFMLQLYRHWDTTEFFSHSIRKLLGYIRTNRTNNPNIFELSVKNEKSIRSERSPLYPAPPAFGFPLTPPFAPEFPQSISSEYLLRNATVCSKISLEYKLLKV